MFDHNMTDLTMVAKLEWKKALRESNAIGWIAFMVLVVGIGVGAVFFGTDSGPAKVNNPMAANQAK